MNAKNRIYSLPYNGTNPEWFLQEVEKRKKHVDHVYCELPFKEMISHVRFTFDDRKSAGGKSRRCGRDARALFEQLSRIPAALEGQGAPYLSRQRYVLSLRRRRRSQKFRRHVGAGGKGASARGIHPFRLSGGGALARALAGGGDTHLMQRLPVESAANGNLAGEMWRDRIQSPPGNPQDPKQAEGDARRRIPAQMSRQRSLPDGLPEFLQS